jgi:hypothetical protein
MRRRPQTLKSQIDPLSHRQFDAVNQYLRGMDQIEKEAARVADIMRNARTILDDLDRKFEEQTGLVESDIKFLFLAAGLQCLRQYIFSNEAFRLTANEGDRLMGTFVPNAWQDILCSSVPYDAIRHVGFEENTGLSGSTHRYRTLGHDPLLGWVVGPVNIITDSLTKSDIVTTYSVRDMNICGHYPSGTSGAFSDCIHSVQSEKILLPIAVMRQAIHFGSDYFTMHGLPVPILSSLNNDIARSMVARFNIDMYSITRGVALSVLLNTIVSYVHMLFYNAKTDGSREMYEVRTRKIVTYANIVASTSNIVSVAVQYFLGNTKSLKQLDVGGLLVTLYRLFTDYRYIYQLKKEFLSRNFVELVVENKTMAGGM